MNNEANTKPNTEDYSWVTDEMYEDKLERILCEMTADMLLSIPGIHEILSEHFNNQILDELDDDRQYSK